MRYNKSTILNVRLEWYFLEEGWYLMSTIYAYCRASRPTQDPRRQEDIILEKYPNAVVYMERYTGTTQDRPEWNKLKGKVQSGDIIVFDEVSRMGRTGQEAYDEYMLLNERGVILRFIVDSHIDTEFVNVQRQNKIEEIKTGEEYVDDLVNTIISAINKFCDQMILAQIKLAFDKAREEVDRLHYRTSNGMKTKGATNTYTTDADGNKVLVSYGSIAKSKLGKTVETTKAKESKAIILKHSKSFGGSLDDTECRKLCGCSRNSFYKYKREVSMDRNS